MIVSTVRWCSCTKPGFILFFPDENNKKRELELNSVSACTPLRCSFVEKGQGIISVLFHKELRFLLWLNTRSHKSPGEESADEEKKRRQLKKWGIKEEKTVKKEGAPGYFCKSIKSVVLIFPKVRG